jgi:hypothetical protein
MAVDSPGRANQHRLLRQLDAPRRSVNVRELNQAYASGTVFYPLLARGGR